MSGAAGLKVSVVIPAHNEEGCIEATIRDLVTTLNAESIPHEILIVNDNSRDATESILRRLGQEFPSVRYINNQPPNGFGFAVRCGLENYSGDCVAVYMADASDDPKDLVKFYRTMVERRVDCVFGTRWSKGGKVYDYPAIKLFINRLANLFIKVVFQFRYNDTTNAFKLYRSHVMQGLKPFLSHHFNLTVELPLKAMVRGYSYAIVPNSWTNRKAGESKLKIREMGSRYLFIVIYCLIEKWLSRGDYRKEKQMRHIHESA
jgi:dolichol-phosphate mannosyltransferase